MNNYNQKQKLVKNDYINTVELVRGDTRIPAPLPDGLKIDCGASTLRHERTPGGVAVMEVYGEEAGEQFPGHFPKSSPELPKTNSPTKLSKIFDLVKKVCAGGGKFSLGNCSSGKHHFAKKHYCGKEYCPVCGKKRSPAHNRRISRILPKVFHLVSMGYFVIEYPDKYRKDVTFAYSRKALDAASKKIVEVLAGKRCGRKGRVGGYFSRGLMRWHWFGDKIQGKWNPHCNVLVDGGFIPDDKLEEIKAALRVALGVPELIIHYSYFTEPGEKFQKVEYITRATFNQYSWSPYMARELSPMYKYVPNPKYPDDSDTEFNIEVVKAGFRNQRWWGDWSGKAAWSLADLNGEDTNGLFEIAQFDAGICPDCGLPLETIRISEAKGNEGNAVKWSAPMDAKRLIALHAVEIGNSGYYRIPHREYTGSGLDLEARIILEKKQGLHHLVYLDWMETKERTARDNEDIWDDILSYADDAISGDECPEWQGSMGLGG